MWPLCACGCGEDLRAHMQGRPPEYISQRRFLQHHQNRGQQRRRRREMLFDWGYFEAMDCGFETPCWIWKMALTNKWYGKAWSAISKRYMLAHLAVWEERLGPFPVGRRAYHLCQVKSCVNPSHIEPVTQSELMRRRR